MNDHDTTGAGHPDSSHRPDDEATHKVTVFQAVGGQVFFDRMVERFYAHVAVDPVLLELYPDQVDLRPAQERLALFLGQFWGGPTTYSDSRGHPRLRMRHNPFVIDPRAGEHWVAAMLDALAHTIPEAPLNPDLAAVVQERMTEYFVSSATHMVNAPDGADPDHQLDGGESRARS